MTTVSLNEAQNRLAHLIGRLSPGEVVTITENERPVAQIVPLPTMGRRSPRPRPRPPETGVPKAGQYEGRLVVPDDFDAPLEELREYME